MAMGFKQRERVGRETQMEHAAVGPAAAQQFGIESCGEADDRPRLRALAGTQMGPDFKSSRQDPLDQRLDRAAAGLEAMQARLDHLGVVEHQQIARLKQLGQLVKNTVNWLGLAAIEQTRSST